MSITMKSIEHGIFQGPFKTLARPRQTISGPWVRRNATRPLYRLDRLLGLLFACLLAFLLLGFRLFLVAWLALAFGPLFVAWFGRLALATNPFS